MSATAFPSSILLTTAYLPPVSYFALLYAANDVLIEQHEHYVKQTYRNRCLIAGPDGPLPLTVPVERGEGKTATCNIRISEHGNWRHLHWNALVSAYENSPYFEYYADDFEKFYQGRTFDRLIDFNQALLQLVCDELSLSPRIALTQSYVTETDRLDFRETLRPKSPSPACFKVQPYWQVFQERTGFQPDLSVVDLLFNLGPESRILLKKSIDAEI